MDDRMVPKSSLGHKKSDPGVMAISGQYFRLSNFENTSLTEISPHNYQAMGGLFKVLRFQALPPASSWPENEPTLQRGVET